MAPIHDSDIGSERWSRAEWDHYELWEKVEVRLRRRKWMWILLATAVFLLLSAVPTVIEQWPHWTSMTARRRLAREINLVKREAAVEHQAFRLEFPADGRLEFTVRRVASCEDRAGAAVRTGSLVPAGKGADYRMLSAEEGRGLDIPGLVTSICYDALQGSHPAKVGQSLVGFAIAPVKDLSQRRMDRMAMLLIDGPDAVSSFE